MLQASLSLRRYSVVQARLERSIRQAARPEAGSADSAPVLDLA